jgi:hypothetical protein
MNKSKIIMKNYWEIEKTSLEQIETKYTAEASDMGVFWK